MSQIHIARDAYESILACKFHTKRIDGISDEILKAIKYAEHLLIAHLRKIMDEVVNDKLDKSV